jgi:hypothetical protein
MAADLPKEMLFDVRILERHVRKGLLSQKELEARLRALEDKTDAAAPLETTKLEPGGGRGSVAARREEEEEID